jgi:hypothetical protein
VSPSASANCAEAKVTRPVKIELLALPGWQAPPRSLDDWVAQLTNHAGPVVVTREDTDVSWLEVAQLQLRGYAMLVGRNVDAINFELADSDPAPATCAVTAAAEVLGWEIHLDDEDEVDDESD